MEPKVKLYYCSAEADEAHRRSLDRHLTTLKRQMHVEPWHTSNTLPGADRATESQRRLEDADVIVLLLSTHLLTSCDAAINQAIARHKDGQIALIPIRVHPVDLNGSPLEKLQALPVSGEFIGTGTARRKDRLWVEVVSKIRKSVEAILSRQSVGDSELSHSPKSNTLEKLAPDIEQQVDSLLIEMQRLSKSVSTQSAKALGEQVRIAEIQNPGLCFTVETNASNTRYTISPKPGIEKSAHWKFGFHLTMKLEDMGLRSSIRL